MCENLLTATVSTPDDDMGHSIVLLWGPKPLGCYGRWFEWGERWDVDCVIGVSAELAVRVRQSALSRVSGLWW